MQPLEMTKQKILLLIPLIIIAGLLIYSFTIFINTGYILTWRHDLAFGLFLVLITLFFKKFRIAVVATGLYLIIGTCNLLTMTQEVRTSWFTIFSLETPHINLLSLGLFCFYFILNFDTLTNIYFDYKEEKSKQ